MQKYIPIFFYLFILAEGVKEGPDVVGGVSAKLKERPFQVSLQKFGTHICGGSIISRRYVLTAAHCQAGFNFLTALFVSANAGMIDVHRPRQRHYMQRFIKHEKFQQKFFYRYDIALVKLWSRFHFDSYVQPVRLPTPHLPVPANSAVILSGWGSLGGADKKVPAILHEVALEVVDQGLCKERVEKNKDDRLFNTNLCAYNPKVRKGQCSGDSGGPLTYGRVQVGIVSWSNKDPYCASTVIPGVYTRVPEYIDWIVKHAR